MRQKEKLQRLESIVAAIANGRRVSPTGAERHMTGEDLRNIARMACIEEGIRFDVSAVAATQFRALAQRRAVALG